MWCRKRFCLLWSDISDQCRSFTVLDLKKKKAGFWRLEKSMGLA
jgi:hypothetical protein